MPPYPPFLFLRLVLSCQASQRKVEHTRNFFATVSQFFFKSQSLLSVKKSESFLYFNTKSHVLLFPSFALSERTVFLSHQLCSHQQLSSFANIFLRSFFSSYVATQNTTCLPSHLYFQYSKQKQNKEISFKKSQENGLMRCIHSLSLYILDEYK